MRTNVGRCRFAASAATCLIPFLFAKTLHGQGILLFSAFFVALNDGSLEK